MHKALIVAAGLALTSFPALANDQGMGQNDSQQSYDGDQGDNGSMRSEWRGEGGGWRQGERQWRRHGDDQAGGQRSDDEGSQGSDEQGARRHARRMGGAAFHFESGTMKLSVRCGRGETIRDCIAAAAPLLGRSPDGAADTASPTTPSNGPQPAAPKQP